MKIDACQRRERGVNMKKTSNKFPEICMAAEYIIGIYGIVTAVINLLNIAGVTTVTTWCMKPTFFGVSLLLLLLLQYGLINANRKNMILVKLRPYVMGILAAGVVSTLSLPLCLLLALVMGHFLLSGFPNRYTAREALFVLLATCVCMEIYSIAMLLQGDVPERAMGRFMRFTGVDVFFILAAVIYCISVREPNKHFLRLRGRLAWFRDNPKRAVRSMGSALCVLSLGLFTFFAVTCAVGENKLADSQEEVYLLVNREDPSLALTVTKGEEEDSYILSFQEYEGTNNQKVQLINYDEDIYQLVFLEPECALTADLSTDLTELVLKAEPSAAPIDQGWSRMVVNEVHNWYMWFPVEYGFLSGNEELSEVTFDVSSGDYEFFILKRTIEDEFVTHLLEQYRDEFAPTILMETVITLFGPFAGVIILLITLTLVMIIYLRRLIGDKLAALYAILFAYMVTYGAISTIILYFLVFGWQCYYCYCRRREL